MTIATNCKKYTYLVYLLLITQLINNNIDDVCKLHELLLYKVLQAGTEMTIR